MEYIIQKKALIIANALIKAGTERKAAFTQAWKEVKEKATKLLSFTTTKGEDKIRVVASNISEFFTPKGTGKKRPEGLHIFADMAKVITGKPYVIISAYVGCHELI